MRRKVILISKLDRELLEKAGALQPKRKNRKGDYEDANFVIVNKSHKSKRKHTYVVETTEMMAFLGKYSELNLQRIRPNQLNLLKEKGLVGEHNIQKQGTYVPNATVFIDGNGQAYCKKIANYMFALGLWKNNRA